MRVERERERESYWSCTIYVVNVQYLLGMKINCRATTGSSPINTPGRISNLIKIINFIGCGF